MVYYLTRFACWLTGHVPRPVRLAIAGPITVLVYYAWAAKRRATIANMAQVLGVPQNDPRAKRLARRSWRNYGRYVSDFFYLPNATFDELLARMKDVTPPPGAFSLIDQALAPGKGVILVSFHFGAWDVAAVMVRSHVPVDLIVESFDDPRMDKLVMEQRGKLGLGIIRIEKTPRRILRALQENRIVAVAVDKPVPPHQGVPVTFFGKTCYVPGGIAQLALKSGAAILPGYCRYDKNYSSTYYIGASPPIFPERTGDKRADTIALMQQMFSAMEEIIRQYPDQWEMFRRFWPEDDATISECASPERLPTAVAAPATGEHAHG
ncbi:MAG TPA: lysophospholipid acyltransferase family protein [Ktedonobacterales bacterium]|nr:lysophospholipid acyltransferase family protein [Ktedonobacterales bacterium]